MGEMGTFASGAAIGLFVGFSMWFPYKHHLRKALKKRQEAVSILVELSKSEQESAAEEMVKYINSKQAYSNPSNPWFSTTGANPYGGGYSITASTPQITWVSSSGTSAGLPVAGGTWTPTSASATTTIADSDTLGIH